MVTIHGKLVLCPMLAVYVALEGLFVLLTVAALLDVVFDLHWGLGWLTFFCAFIAAAWGAMFYPICENSLGWRARKR